MYYLDAEEATGVISDNDIEAWAQVVSDAFSVHVDRERVRKGLWKNYPARDQAVQVRTKIDRILHSLELLESDDLTESARAVLAQNVLEESSDIINYTVFTARIVSGRV